MGAKSAEARRKGHIGSSRLRSGLLAGIAVVCASPALAQQVSVPTPTREDIDPVPATKETAKPRLKVEGDVERSPCALDDPAYQNIKLKLTSASFRNLGPVPAAELASTYSDYIGTEQPIEVVCRIRDAAATKLRAMGYIAAVQVPTQKIEEGAVAFEVLYAKVTSIRVVGNAGANERQLEGFLSKLADGELFNRYRAERYLLLARDIPGYEVRLALKPAGTGAGEMIGEVTLRRTPFTVDFSTQNLGTRSTGRIGGQVRAVFNGLTGMGDRTMLAYYSTSDFSEQHIAQFGHDFLIGKNGLRFGGRMTYAWTKPDLGPTIPDVSARTLFLNAEASYPFIRRQAFTLRGALGVDLINQRVAFAGAPLSEDRVRVGYLRLDADAVDLKGVGPSGNVGWRMNGSIEARKGLDILGASLNCGKNLAICSLPSFIGPSLIDGNPTATVFRASANVELRPIRKLTVSFSPRVQTSSSALFAFEQFSTGNYSIGRGFDPGSIVGDRGAGFQTEVKLDTFRLSPKSIFDVQPYVFADNAWVWDRASPIRNPQKLRSIGGGMRIGIASRARLDLSVALPRTILPGETKRRDPRFLASLTTNILPWSDK
jgi:hemolysin activation/secretion protein